MSLALSRTGAGAPLVLLHALGSSSHAWEAVVPALAERFEVVAVDLPGFGRSPAWETSRQPTPAALAEAVAESLQEAGVNRPHVVGNSLGGWVGLELARVEPLATLTLLSPAGMWRHGTPLYCRVSLSGTRWLTEHLPGMLRQVVGHPFGRAVVLGQTHGRPWRLTAAQARRAVDEMGTCTGFAATLRATIPVHYRDSGGRPLPPVTVAFGTRDLILASRRWRRVDEIPGHVAVRTLPGCGHIPMYDDPQAVVALIMASTGQGGRTGG